MAKGCPSCGKNPTRRPVWRNNLLSKLDCFLRDEEKNFVDLRKQELHLSPIFKWYGEDFGKDDAEIIQFVADYFPPKTAEALRGWIQDSLHRL